MNKSLLQLIKPIFFLFIAVTAICLIGKYWLEKHGIDSEVVLVGNVILFAISTIVCVIYFQSVESSNHPQSSVRALYITFILKFFTLALSAFVYIIMNKKKINKSGLLICVGLYVIYTVLEKRAQMRMVKNSKNA